MDLLLRWNKELKIQNALGSGGSDYTVLWGSNLTGMDKFIIESGAESSKGGQMSVRALHEYHAVAIAGGFHKDVGGIECLPARWSKSRGWENVVTSKNTTEKVVVPITIEELEAM